jgi:hypothetical protein
MNDGYKSDDLEFCAALLYLYGEESLLSIDCTNTRAIVMLDVPSEDAKILREQFVRDELSILLKSYCRIFSSLVHQVRRTRTALGQRWDSPRWRKVLSARSDSEM